jgi:hypothetical protein
MVPETQTTAVCSAEKNEAAFHEGEDGLACKGAPFGSAKSYSEIHRKRGLAGRISSTVAALLQNCGFSATLAGALTIIMPLMIDGE